LFAAAYLTTAAIPFSDICPLLFLQPPTNLTLITTFPTCTYRDCAITCPHMHTSGRGMELARGGARCSTSWCHSWCLRRLWCHGSQCPGGCPPLSKSVRRLLLTPSRTTTTLRSAPYHDPTLSKGVQGPPSTPPHPVTPPSAVQKSVRAFVDTLTHYHHSPLCALP